MPYVLGCPSCSTRLTVADSSLGGVVKCPKCGTALRVPASMGPPVGAVTVPPAPAPAAPPKPAHTPAPRVPQPAGAPAPRAAAPSAPAKPAPPKPAPAATAPAPRPAPKLLDDVEVMDEPPPSTALPPRPVPRAPRAAPPPAPVETPLEEVDGDVGKKPNGTVDFEVPEHLRQQINDELSKGEKLIWVGQPSRRIIRRRALPWAILPALGGFAMGVVMLVGALAGKSTTGSSGGSDAVLGSICAGVTLLLACGYSWMILAYAQWKARRTCYAITSRRCIVWYCKWHGGVTMTNYPPTQLTGMYSRRLWFFSRGGGDLVFHSVTTVTVTTYRGGGSDVSSRTRYYGFLAIERVGDIEKLIRETLIDRMMDKMIM